MKIMIDERKEWEETRKQKKELKFNQHNNNKRSGGRIWLFCFGCFLNHSSIRTTIRTKGIHLNAFLLLALCLAIQKKREPEC